MARAEQPAASSDWSCDESLETVARYVATVRAAPGTRARLRAAASVDGPRAARQLLRELPVVPAPFTDSPAGTELRSWFGAGRRLPLDRMPVAHLLLPTTNAEYLRGRPKQALRTNMSRSDRAGVTVVDRPDEWQLRAAVLQLAARRGQDPDRMISARARAGLCRRFALALDSAGAPVALTEIIVDGDWAGLGALVTASDHPDAPTARYRLFAHGVATLIAEEVGHLVVGGSMLLSAAGTRYFQRRTGFQPVRLQLAAPVPAQLRTADPESVQSVELVG